MTLDLDELQRLEANIAALDDNPNVFERVCESCGIISPATATSASCCHSPKLGDKVFVGQTPCDGDAWGAAGSLLDLVQRLAPLLAEVRRLRCSPTALQIVLEQRDGYREERDQLRAQCESLKAEMARLVLRSDPVADRVSISYMRDNHTFAPLFGGTLDDIVAHAERERAVSPWGMLCPVIVLAGGVELRRVGSGVHCDGKRFDAAALDAWRKAVSADPDIARLVLATGGEHG